MSFLVDTHVLIWLLESPEKLSDSTRLAIADDDNPVYLSYYSLLEMKLKSLKGKLRYNEQLMNQINKLNIRIVLPNLSDLVHLEIYNPLNKDPFDNLLISLAIANSLTLVTDDERILATKVRKLLTLRAN